jgi:hypothetical protein
MPLKILLYSHLMWMYNVQLEEIWMFTKD